MNVGSLFTGIGGLDLGLERAGMNIVWQAEIDPYASRVLAKHWPQVPNLGDVTLVDWSSVQRVDLICGGYPCQPFSHAGRRGGTDDPRHLWPHFARSIRHLRPRYALLENVPGHLSLGFGSVLGDLADLGYDAEWECIPAAAVGAPHLRYRVFVVAHAADSGRRRRTDRQGDRRDAGVWGEAGDHTADSGHAQRRTMADTAGVGLQGRSEGIGGHGPSGGNGRGEPARSGRRIAPLVPDTDQQGPRHRRPEPSRRGEPVQLADWWAVEPEVGRVADGIPHRVDRLRALGNAVVPQVAEWIGHRIMKAAA